MPKVYVIMRNDYPAGVVDSLEQAERDVKSLKTAELERVKKESPGYAQRIYWRWYEFELNANNYTSLGRSS